MENCGTFEAPVRAGGGGVCACDRVRIGQLGWRYAHHRPCVPEVVSGSLLVVSREGRRRCFVYEVCRGEKRGKFAEKRCGIAFVYDSWGKWPSGQFSGNQYDFGNYDQCRGFVHQHANVGTISGRYCMVVVPQTVSESEKRVFIDTGGINGVVMGMCFPSYCSEQRLKQPVSVILETVYHVNSNSLQIQCETEPDVSSAANILAVTIFSIILVFVVASTIYDAVASMKSFQSSPVFTAFSVYSNWPKLMKTTTTPVRITEKSNVIDCIHGMRVLAILWIIFGHSYLLLTSSPLINPVATLDWEFCLILVQVHCGIHRWDYLLINVTGTGGRPCLGAGESRVTDNHREKLGTTAPKVSGKATKKSFAGKA
ncbi:hypothetical protein RP20_CCG008421 [Aedes albopictus]|nr:hypothetical protein RP20_CCG008421 [Aedes albopictus]